MPGLTNRTQDAIFEVFGAGLPIVIVALLVVAYAIFDGRAWPFPGTPRYGFAGLTGSLFLFGVLGLFHPAFALGQVHLEQVSSGGRLGAWLAGPPDLAGIGRIAVLALVTYALCWPPRAWSNAKATGRLIRASVIGLARVARRTPSMARQIHIDPPARLARRLRFSKPGSVVAVVAQATPEVVLAQGPNAEKFKPAPEPKSPGPAKKGPSQYTSATLPPIELLEVPTQMTGAPVDVAARVKQIEAKLAEYGVDARVIEVNQGPTVTQFGIEPGWEVKTREVRERDSEGRPKFDKNGSPLVRLEEVSRVRVKVARILALANDLALALAVPSVRIEAPVPGKSVVGLEVPNVSSSLVSLRRVIETQNFQKLRAKSKLALGLGQDVAGNAVVADLAKMPHCLIAGATGSGKSVCVNAVVASILMHATPEEVRILMVDPKRVELIGYNDIPHLLAPVVVDTPKVVGALRWVLKEMERRYKEFAEVGVRNIDGYNTRRLRDGDLPLPFLVVIIDELADLMMVAAEEVERIIVRLAQLARATGIHLIIATQRPSVDVVTGLIKANVPTRIAFAVSSSIDSRTILDGVGAEKLLGRGDMLYSPPDAAKPVRLQGVFVSDHEIDEIVAWWKASRPAQYIDELVNIPDEPENADEDPMLDEARRLVGDHGRISTSFLQRRLRIGYNRAARLMDSLEEEGLVEPPDSRRAVAAGVFD